MARKGRKRLNKQEITRQDGEMCHKKLGEGWRSTTGDNYWSKVHAK